jgi:hypothetical protein
MPLAHEEAGGFEDGANQIKRNETMWSRLKSCSLAACLFVFLFVVVGASLHLKPMGAFLAASSDRSS